MAELVGVREATLFHYFSSKQELQQAVLAERDNRAMDMAGETIGDDDLPVIAARNEQEPGLTTLYAVAWATASETSDGIQLQWLYDKTVSMPEGLRQAIALLKVPVPAGVS